MTHGRQQVRAELRAQAFKEVNAKYGLEPRPARRRIARAWAKAAWRRGERIGERFLAALGMTILALGGGAASSAPTNVAAAAARIAAATRIVAGVATGAVATLVGAGEVWAQGSRKDDLVINARGLPVGGATVRVCTSNATGQPCSPLALIYSDAALTQALVNPTSTDGLGNYSFYAAPGRYLIEISGPAITTKQIPNVILPNDPSAPTFTSLTTTSGITAFTLTLSGNLTVGGNASVSGNLALTNQAAAPGTPAAGTVSLYTKSADKKLYFKDDTGAESGPLGTGASPAADNTWTNNNRFKGPVPWRDITAYGASSSTQGPFTGSITSGTATLTITSAGDWKNGQGIAVIGAGATSSLGVPPTTTATLASSPTGAVRSSNTVTLTTTAAHGLVVGDTILVTGVTDTSFNGFFTVKTVPLTTTVTYVQVGANATSGSGSLTTNVVAPHGTTGSTTYNYQIVGLDASGGYSAASSNFQTTTAVATLTVNNYNFLHWKFLTGAVGYIIYSDKGLGGALTCVGTAYTNAYGDYGLPFPCPEFAPTNPPGAAGPQALLTTVSAGQGTTTLTLAANASNTVASKNVYHDESSFLNQAIVDAQNDVVGFGSSQRGGGIVYVPPGNYWITKLVIPGGPTAIELRLAGSLNLTILPILITAGHTNIHGTAGGQQQANGHFPTTPINVPATVGAGIVLNTNQGQHTIKNISLQNLQGHGIQLAGGVNGVYLSEVDISENTATGAGSPLLIGENVLFTYVEHSVFSGKQAVQGLPAIYFNGISTQTSSVDNFFRDLELNWHTIRMDQPIGNDGTGGANQHMRFDNIVAESNYDSGFFTFDGGHSNLDGVGLTDLTFNRIDDADVISPSTHSFLYFLNPVANSGATISGLTLDHASYATLIGSAVRPPPIVSGLYLDGHIAVSGAQAGGIQDRFYTRQSGNALEVGMPLQVVGAGAHGVEFQHVLNRPELVTATPGGGGSCGAGTYYYKLTFVDVNGGETLGSEEASATVGASGSVTLTWDFRGRFAASLRVYRGTAAGGESTYYTVTSYSTGTFTDTCAAGTAGSPPLFSTAYSSRLADTENVPSWLLGGASGSPFQKLGIGGVPSEKLHVVGASNNLRVDGQIQAGNINSVRFVDGVKFAFTAAGINAAISDLPSTGGIVDARAMLGAQTISEQVNVGSATKPVILLLPHGATWTCTVNNPANSCFVVYEDSGMLADGIAENGFKLTASAGMNVASMIRNDQSVALQSIIYLRGIMLYQANIGTVGNAVLDIAGIAGKSVLENIQVATFSGIGGWFHNTTTTNTGDFTCFNCEFNGNSTAGARPVVVESTSATRSVQNITFYRGGIEHPGATKFALEVNGHGTAEIVSHITFDGVRFEGHSTDVVTDMVKVADAEGVMFLSPRAVFAAGSAGWFVGLTETLAGADRAFKVLHAVVSNGNVVNNTISGATETITGRDADYIYLSPTFVSGGNKDTTKIGGATFIANKSVRFDSHALFSTGEPLTDIRAALTGTPGSAGAVCDGSTDDAAAIIASIATVGARTSARGTSGGLFIPDNTTCSVASPIISHVADLRLYGISKMGSVISASGTTGFRGPLFVQTPPTSLYPVLPTGTALLTGSGSSYLGDGTANYWLDLRMCKDCAELNGLTAFTAETTFNVTTTASRNGFLTSSGQADSIDGILKAFALWTETDGTLVCQLRTSAGFSSIAGGAVSTGTNQHAALSWDGTTLRCFLNGTQVASTARSGTLSQRVYEAVRIGPDQANFPDSANNDYGNPNGRMDGVRLSNNARYTSGFTPPTAKWGTPDANTLIQLNFDSQPDIFTVGRQKDNIPVYLPVIRPAGSFGNKNGLHLAHLTLDTFNIAEGPFVYGALDFEIEDVRLQVAHNGMLVESSYNGHIRGLECNLNSNTARWCFAHGAVTGIADYQDFKSTGNPFYHFFFLAPSGNYGPFFISPQSGTPTGGTPVVFRGGGAQSSINAHDITVDSENGAALGAMALFDGLDVATVIGGAYDINVASTTAGYQVEGGGEYNFIGPRFNLTATTPTQLFNILGTPSKGVNVMGLYTSNTPNVLVNTAGLPYFNRVGRDTTQTVVTFSATPTFDAVWANNFKITLTGNVTSSTLSNARVGQVLTFQICQDATGSRTFVWPTNVKGATTIGSTLSTCSAQSFKFDGTNAYALAAGVINQ